MESESFGYHDSLEIIDCCLDNFRKSQLEQISDLFEQGSTVIEVSGAVLFACHLESSKFAAFFLSHNVYGLDCFQRYGFEIFGRPRGSNSVFRVKVSFEGTEDYVKFNEASVRKVFLDFLAGLMG